jgi:FkbM family methyltransferase
VPSTLPSSIAGVDVGGALRSRLWAIDPRLGARVAWAHWLREHDTSARAVEELVEPGGVALDIGADVGTFTWALRRRVGPRGEVHAFEPNPRDAATLERVRGEHANVHIHRLALSDRQGTLPLRVPVSGGRPRSEMGSLEASHAQLPGGQSITFEVQVERLDDVLGSAARSVDFIKCDVEGHEDRVLDGATGTLERFRPNVLIEIEQRHRTTEVQVALDRLLGLGLVGWALFPDGVRGLDDFEVERDQLRFLDQARATGQMPPGYVNNFLFTRPTAASDELVARINR